MSDHADPSGLKAAIAALEQELLRLKENLETHRLLDHPQQATIVRELIEQIDSREDHLLELQRMLVALTVPQPPTPPADPLH